MFDRIRAFFSNSELPQAGRFQGLNYRLVLCHIRNLELRLLEGGCGVADFSAACRAHVRKKR